MKRLIYPLILLITIHLFTACNTTEIHPSEELIGTWTVTKVEGRQMTNGVQGIVLTDDAPAGFIQFDNDGSGEQDYSFSLFGNSYPNTGAFIWTSNETEVRIDLFTSPDMIWRREVNSASKQVATYDIAITEEMSIEYQLTLER